MSYGQLVRKTIREVWALNKYGSGDTIFTDLGTVKTVWAVLEMQQKLILDDQWSEGGWTFSVQQLSDLGSARENQRDLF